MSIRILVVENHSTLRRDYELLFNTWGYAVAVAEGEGDSLIANAKSKARQEECDLLVADKRLLDDYDPNDRSGFELAKELAPLPCIIVTTHPDRKELQAAWQEGLVLDYVVQSDGPRALKEALARALPKVWMRRRINSGTAWALLVGVNHYEDKFISDLGVCVADVTAMQQSLAGDYQVISLLTDATPDNLPTRAQILGQLAAVAQAAAEDDLLLFFFSGHGIAEAGESYLLPRDVRTASFKHTAVSMHDVREIMDQSPARAKVIVLDACHSGAAIGKAEPVMTEEFIRRVFAEAEGIVVLASCRQGQKSWPWEEKGRSVFTYYLLEALEGRADFDKKGFVTVNDVSRYVTDGVKQWAANAGVGQTPTLHSIVTGDIVLRHCSVPAAKPA